MNQYESKSNQNTLSPSSQLAIIAGALITLGDALSTVATFLSIQEKTGQSIQIYTAIENLQKQMNEIHMETKQIKKMLKNKRT